MSEEAIVSGDNIVHLVANGRVDVFYFDFYFFQDEDVKVFENDRPAPSDQYHLEKNSVGIAADYPYRGGSVRFDSPPPAGTKITIKRRLKIERSIDYQPTLQIDPVHLNRDLNFFMECIREFGQRLQSLQSLESVEAGEIAEKVEALNARIASLDGATDFARTADLVQITEAIATITAGLAALEGRIPILPQPPADYIIDTATINANTWWRKWNSGWVEQGMPINVGATGGSVFHLPVTMANTVYAITNSVQSPGSGQGSFNFYNKTASSFTAKAYWNNNESNSLSGYVMIAGYAA